MKKPFLWGTEINKLTVYHGGKKTGESRTVTLAFYPEEDRVELSPFALDRGEYTIVYSQMNLTEDGRREWRSIILPFVQVIGKTGGGYGVVLRSDKRTRAEVTTDKEPEPEEVLHLLGVKL
jgi:hypothetical protein